MNIRIINMLEALKKSKNIIIADFLDETDIQEIKNWYFTYSKQESPDLWNCIDLLYYLYIRENIDYYPLEDYQRTVTSIAKQHCIEPQSFLNLLSDFRSIVFNN